MQKLNKILKRNIKMIEEEEPNKLKAEIYRLRYEQQKLEKAKKTLAKQKDQLNDLKREKIALTDFMMQYKQQQEKERIET